MPQYAIAMRSLAASVLTADAFLRAGGGTLLLLAVLGYILPSGGGPPPSPDIGQTIGRTVLASVALIGARASDTVLRRRLSLAIGVTLFVFGSGLFQ
jgi:hypothetical protein